jgi:hypothetical protein
MSSTYKLTLSPKTIESAEPKAQSVLAKAQSQVGFIPNMYAAPRILLSELPGHPSQPSIRSPSSRPW